MLAEKRINVARIGLAQEGDQLGWTSGFENDTVRSSFFPPQRDVTQGTADVTDGFGSSHISGVNVLYCDGSVRMVRYGVDFQVWRNVTTRNGGELIDFSTVE
jgi:prepilin-type processing-associated H-X9-DG protein